MLIIAKPFPGPVELVFTTDFPFSIIEQTTWQALYIIQIAGNFRKGKFNRRRCTQKCKIAIGRFRFYTRTTETQKLLPGVENEIIRIFQTSKNWVFGEIYARKINGVFYYGAEPALERIWLREEFLGRRTYDFFFEEAQQKSKQLIERENHRLQKIQTLEKRNQQQFEKWSAEILRFLNEPGATLLSNEPWSPNLEIFVRDWSTDIRTFALWIIHNVLMDVCLVVPMESKYDAYELAVALESAFQKTQIFARYDSEMNFTDSWPELCEEIASLLMKPIEEIEPCYFSELSSGSHFPGFFIRIGDYLKEKDRCQKIVDLRIEKEQREKEEREEKEREERQKQKQKEWLLEQMQDKNSLLGKWSQDVSLFASWIIRHCSSAKTSGPDSVVAGNLIDFYRKNHKEFYDRTPQAVLDDLHGEIMKKIGPNSYTSDVNMEICDIPDGQILVIELSGYKNIRHLEPIDITENRTDSDEDDPLHSFALFKVMSSLRNMTSKTVVMASGSRGFSFGNLEMGYDKNFRM